MKYNFDNDGINKMYDNVVEDSLNVFHSKTTNWEDVGIKISIGKHEITVPNTADNVEELFNMIKRCRENTIDEEDKEDI